MNVIEFPKLDTQEQDEVDALVDSLKDNLDELIFLKITKDGEVGLGHTPLSNGGAIIMFHKIQAYLNHILSHEDNMGTLH